MERILVALRQIALQLHSITMEDALEWNALSIVSALPLIVVLDIAHQLLITVYLHLLQ